MHIATITQVLDLNCQLVLTVEHYHGNGTFWFRENYQWQGREGLKRKRQTDDLGRALLVGGAVAPTRVNHRGEDPEPYLPSGGEWLRYDTPYLDVESLLTTIQSIHQQRVRDGWPQDAHDSLRMVEDKYITQTDRDGCSQLIAKFQYLIGYEVQI